MENLKQLYKASIKDSQSDMNEIRITLIDKYNIDVTAPGREKEKQELQKIFCKYCYYYMGLTLNRIGVFLNRDHATVLHSCRKYDDLYFADRDFRHLADHLIGLFHNISSKDHDQKMFDACVDLVTRSSEADRARYYAAMIEVRRNPNRETPSTEKLNKMILSISND